MTKNDPNLLTQAEYARTRKARGLSGGSRESVRKAVDAGRISAFGPDKLIDQALADAQWDRNTRVRAATGAPDQAATEDAASGDLLTLPLPVDPPLPAGPGEEKDAGYQESRARQAAADARMAELKLAETEGQLVRIDQVRAELATRLAPVREGLLQFPARIASILAAQSDPGRIQTLLEAEIHQVLAPLSMTREVRAAEGAGAA